MFAIKAVFIHIQFTLNEKIPHTFPQKDGSTWTKEDKHEDVNAFESAQKENSRIV